MSRSRKKPWITDRNPYAKKLGNKKLRRKTKQALHHGKEPPTSKHEGVNQYDIRDWKFNYEHWKPDRWTTEEELKKRIKEAKRK
jgi:hypothetical protein